MDVDVEIISEHDGCARPLFDSIMNAMNSMKEATADKIYKRIQREGENSYSRPQVDRALANALRYGIFEKRNNRYRVRDDVLDDEDTIYWKLKTNKLQTPFRLQEDLGDIPKGPVVDPEKDNRRFSNFKCEEKCARCRRLKRPQKQRNPKQKPTNGHQKTKRLQKEKEKRNFKSKPSSKITTLKRKLSKKKKLFPKMTETDRKTTKLFNETQAAVWAVNSPCLRSFSFDGSLNDLGAGKNIMLGKSTYDSTDSEEDTMSSPTDEQSFKSYHDEEEYSDPYKKHRSLLSSEYDYLEGFGYTMDNKTKSNESLKSDNGTEKNELSATNRTTSSLSDVNVPTTSKTFNSKKLSEYLSKTSEVGIDNQVEGNKNNKCSENTDWMGCSEAPQTAIIQTKNVLTIEPMDSLALKSPDHTSYVS